MVANARGVDAVDRALRLLLAFRTGDAPLTLVELSTRTRLHKSTILRLATSLIEAGLMYRNAEGGFRLGAGVLALSGVFRSSFRIDVEIRPRLEALMRSLGENASFFIREGRHRVCIARCEAAHTVRHVIVEGERLPLDATATGLVLQGSEGHAIKGLPGPFAPVFTTGIADLHSASMASAVRDVNGAIAGAVTVSGPSFRFTREIAERGARQLIDAAAEFSAQLGYVAVDPPAARVPRRPSRRTAQE